VALPGSKEAVILKSSLGMALGLLAGLAAHAQAATPVAEGLVVGKAPIRIVVVARGARGDAPGLVKGIDVEGDITNDVFAEDTGWRSMRMRLDVSCLTRSAWIRDFKSFDTLRRAGPSQTERVPDGWARPSRGAYLEGVIDAICGAGAKALRPVDAALEVRKGPNVPSPPRPEPTATASPAGFVVQIAAASDEAGARAALAALSDVASPSTVGLNPYVAPARVRGRLVFRALVGGLSTPADAQAFCAAIQRAKGACFVHR
jgi:hypothetical protein